MGHFENPRIFTDPWSSGWSTKLEHKPTVILVHKWWSSTQSHDVTMNPKRPRCETSQSQNSTWYDSSRDKCELKSARVEEPWIIACWNMLEHLGTMTPFDLPHLALIAVPGVPLSTIHATIFATATQAAVDLQRHISVGFPHFWHRTMSGPPQKDQIAAPSGHGFKPSNSSGLRNLSRMHVPKDLAIPSRLWFSASYRCHRVLPSFSQTPEALGLHASLQQWSWHLLLHGLCLQAPRLHFVREDSVLQNRIHGARTHLSQG